MRMDLDHPDFYVTVPPLLRTLFAEILFQVLGVVLRLVFLLLDDRADEFLKRHYDRRHIWGGATACRSRRWNWSCGSYCTWRGSRWWRCSRGSSCGRSGSDHSRWGG